MSITIKDVARESGFSITTVSMVLNKKPVSIPEETRRKVEDTALKLNYRPNQLAISLITKKTRTIGLIIPDISNLFFAGLTKAIEESAWENGYNVICGSSNNDVARDIEYLEVFLDRKTDGIIMIRSLSNASDNNKEEVLLRLLESISVPIVLLDRSIPDIRIPVVKLDNHQGGYLATKHLLGLGHTRIGCYTGSKNISSSIERLNGYKSALEESGLPFTPHLIYEGNYQLEGQAEAFEYLIRQEISALFCFNDLMAYGIYFEAQKAGISIPDDLSIVGFDNNVMSGVLQPGLTTMCQPLGGMGKQSVTKLLNMVERRSGTSSLRDDIFAPELITRGSTATCNSRNKNTQ